MTLVELKNFINKGIAPSDFMIFIRKENRFLAKQYIQELSNLADGGINKITSIYSPQQSSLTLLTAPQGTINVLTVETFDERAEDYNQFENIIVICDQVDKSIKDNVNKYIIEFPKLEEWQIFDYAKKLCSGLDDNDILWLIQATGRDVERVVNELDKINLFGKNEQKDIFNAIRFDSQTDLVSVDLFTIVNALVTGDSRTLYEFLCQSNFDSIDPVMLANRALTSLKNIILVTQNPNLTAEDLGVSIKQYNFIKRSYQSLDVNAAKEKLKFLVNFDLQLKSSKLDLSKREMLNYLINHLNYRIKL